MTHAQLPSGPTQARNMHKFRELVERIDLFLVRQVLAMEILDQGQFVRLLVGGIPLNRRDRLEPGTLRRTPSSLTTDELPLVAYAAHDHWLELTVALHRDGQLIQ